MKPCTPTKQVRVQCVCALLTSLLPVLPRPPGIEPSGHTPSSAEWLSPSAPACWELPGRNAVAKGVAWSDTDVIRLLDTLPRNESKIARTTPDSRLKLHSLLLELFKDLGEVGRIPRAPSESMKGFPLLSWGLRCAILRWAVCVCACVRAWISVLPA